MGNRCSEECPLRDNCCIVMDRDLCDCSGCDRGDDIYSGNENRWVACLACIALLGGGMVSSAIWVIVLTSTDVCVSINERNGFFCNETCMMEL